MFAGGCARPRRPARARPLLVLYLASISRQDKGVAELIEAVMSLANVQCRLLEATSEDPYCTRIVGWTRGTSWLVRVLDQPVGVDRGYHAV
jgi:hypothetical protein